MKNTNIQRHLVAVTALLALAAAVAGCAPASPTAVAAAAPDQGKLCEVSNWRRDVVEQACKPGQKVVFLPDSWGNEQLPVIFAAVNCDLRYAVALTKGGVSCIYAALDAPVAQATAAPPASAPAK